ncbi:MAG: nucleotide sugar dehydrogenase [Rhizobiaceae bacterium]|nr:nucleotide sugar dehydrogenase [Rhizobiaceae bacterium]
MNTAMPIAHTNVQNGNLKLVQSVDLPDPENAVVAVLGLGYVGLPLMVGFADNARTIGFDIDESRIASLTRGDDPTEMATRDELLKENMEYSCDVNSLQDADVMVVCVPTPVMQGNRPDYRPVLAATRTIAENMKRGCVVVFESTVDPGTTENKCIPILEEVSGMQEGVDFYVGYSPERVSPGEKMRRVGDIAKIVSGSSPAVTDFLAVLYSRVVKAGLFKAASIKVAEAAKILENTQRDVNIALINEMMQLFDSMDIKVTDVVAAAGSKWNFHKYFPGLVGGHCISVDPFFLLNAGRSQGLSMDMVASARAVNERTAHYISDKVHEMLDDEAHDLQGKRVLVLGRAFKDNCPDIRNSKSFAVMDSLWARGADVFSYDPIADDTHFEGGRGAKVIDDIEAEGPYDAVVVTAKHDCFVEEIDLIRLASVLQRGAPVVDLRGLFDESLAKLQFKYWTP